MTQEKRRPAVQPDVSKKKLKLITDFFAPVKARPVDEKPAQAANDANDANDAKALKTASIMATSTTIGIDEKENVKPRDDAKSTGNGETKQNEETGEKDKTGHHETNEARENTNHVASANFAVPHVSTHLLCPLEYTDFCDKHGFDKSKWIASLSEDERLLLSLEINTLHVTWLAFLHKELTKAYFLNLKQFLRGQKGKTVFPPPASIYSWSHYTPLPEVKCLILGQDPYHNFNQAHGLAFSVLEPTRPPPSLLNIYKALKIDFPAFEAPKYTELLKEGKPGGGNLTKWAKRGVLMLNACLTVEAHKANSHANRGWEQFTEKVIEAAIAYARNENKQGFVIMAWGSPAQKRVSKFSLSLAKKDVPFMVIKSVHPSPLSASRGFFDAHVFAKCNQWLKEQGKEPINWALLEGNDVV